MDKEVTTAKKNTQKSAKTAKQVTNEVKYTVIRDFKDGEDGHYLYKKDDPYPRDGYKPSAERIKNLSTEDNSAGRPFIK